jgi:Targeting protein for Xklp2 (TPX2) domain
MLNASRPNTTKPVGFNFRLDARIEARRVELEEKEKNTMTGPRERSHRLPVPDFKALHTAEEAKLAMRKERYTPVLPVPLNLSTDDRARERQKFDEMIKEKEREVERALEERKREREAEAEKEVREIRRRAVPKAHEIPEWYTKAPKRKEREGGLGQG